VRILKKKNLAKGIITAILAVLLTVVGLKASDLTTHKMSFDTARYHLIYNAFVDAVQTDMSGLSTLITNWAPTANQDILLPVTATYSSGTTFTVPGDYTAQFVALAKVRVDLGSGTLKGSYVASSSYGGGNTTVILHDSILTNPIAGVWVTGARNGLFPYGNGEVNALDYALGTPSQVGLQAAIDAIGVSNRPLLVPSGAWTISSRLNVPANISLKPARGTVFTVTIPDVAIADLSRAAACVVSWVGHGMSNGDLVYLSGITQAQWSALNGHHVVTKINNDSFSIPVNTSAFAGGYVPGTDPGTYSQTVAIYGPIDAGLYQIFSCTGTGKVVIGPGAVKEVYPQWWGAVGDDATDCTAALQAAFDTGMKVVLPTGTYQHTDLAIKASGFRLEGVEKTKSILKPKATAVKGIYTDNLGTSTYINYIVLKNFTLDQSLQPDVATNFGIYLKHSWGNKIEGIIANQDAEPTTRWALGFGTGVYTTQISDSTLNSISMIGESGSDRVTTITFVNLSSSKVYMLHCLAITFLQPIMQGNPAAKFEFEDIANLTILGGDIEGGGVYLKSVGGSNAGIYSQGNNFGGMYGNVWKGSRRYHNGNPDHVFPSTDNGHSYTCTTAGLAGSVEPTWPTTPGGTVTDGGVTWTCDAASPVYPWANYKSGTFVVSQLMDESNAQGSSRYVRWFNDKMVYDETLDHFGFGGGDPDNSGAGVQILKNYLGLDYAYGILGKDSTGAWRYVFTADDSIGRVVIGDPGGTESTLGLLLRSGSARSVGVLPNDLEIYGVGKGVILTNAAGTVTKRVRLNDAGNGLIFETP
jgi:hypothetical protein